MHVHARSGSRAVIVLGALLVVWTGCRENDPVGEDANRAPETYLVQSPNWGESGFYINHIYWDGYDPDGRVDHFEVTVSDSFGNLDEVVWRPTFRTDSLVRFPVGGETGQDQVLGNRFYVRAVDNLGRRDLTPAWIFFGANDARFPEVVFTRAEGESDAFPEFGAVTIGTPERCDAGAPPDTLPAGSRVTFVWTGVDRDSILGTQVGDVTAFEYKLSTVNNQFLGGTLSDTTAVYESLAPGVYTFTVRTTDDGGLQAEGCRYFQVNFDPVARIRRVWDSCRQDSVRAVRVAMHQWIDRRNGCEGVRDWSYVADALPDPPVNPCLPPGFLSLEDTLRVGTEQAAAWWLEFDASGFDPDGDLERLELNVMECSPQTGNCAPRVWTCAPAASDTAGGGGRAASGGPRARGLDDSIVVGPFTSGNWRAVIAGVDELGQRGASGADTLDFRIDRSPIAVTRTDGLDADACDGLFGAAVGDTFRLCDNDTLYVVETIQTVTQQNGAPCPITTSYFDTGLPAPVTVRNYNSFPQEGDTLALAFQLDNQGRRFARLCGLTWGRDLDGTFRIGYARWGVDQTPSGAWEAVDPQLGVRLNDPMQLTPMCFCTIIRQETPIANHTLHVELRDWLQTDAPSGVRVAQRTVRQTVNFTVQDISALANLRYALPGRDVR